MRRLRFTAPLVALALLAACASGGESSGPRRSTNVITPEEWQGQNMTSVFEAVQRLRPAWLQARGQTGLPAVFRNNTRWGGDPSTLRNLPLDEVSEIRYMNGRDATTRFGTGYPGGIIQIIAN